MWYLDHHHRVTASTNTIDARFHPELAIAATVDKFYEYRNSRNKGQDAFEVQRWNDAKDQLQTAKAMYPIYRRPKKRKVLDLRTPGRRGRHPDPPPYGPS